MYGLSGFPHPDTPPIEAGKAAKIVLETPAPPSRACAVGSPQPAALPRPPA